mmetsp:Transcript_10832/g.18420  ORF Transcript_10832/g.18420 Transcript_10832/m.18420 type:complete len:228 (-) Transcript_10832:287-970(-)
MRRCCLSISASCSSSVFPTGLALTALAAAVAAAAAATSGATTAAAAMAAAAAAAPSPETLIVVAKPAAFWIVTWLRPDCGGPRLWFTNASCSSSKDFEAEYLRHSPCTFDAACSLSALSNRKASSRCCARRSCITRAFRYSRTMSRSNCSPSCWLSVMRSRSSRSLRASSLRNSLTALRTHCPRYTAWTCVTADSIALRCLARLHCCCRCSRLASSLSRKPRQCAWM